MSWYEGFEPICRPDVPLSEYTWYRLGGPARWFFRPRDEAEAAALVERCRRCEVPWRLLGRGANVLVRDEGFDGAVIQLVGPHFERVEYDGARLCAGAGVELPRLIRDSIHRGLVGLEVLAGIPGSVGGATRMNAGGRYGEIGQLACSVRLLDADGQIVSRKAAEVGFAYRRTNLAGCAVLATTLELQPGDREAALERHRRIWSEKHAQQPAVALRSAGCIFKNPPGRSAGWLLEQAGLKGVRIGGAQISEKHANFIVAEAGAKARDVLDLICLARDRVWNRSGIQLELEIDVW
jgi:UDP-N-acetylmuramate dehydrogenase